MIDTSSASRARLWGAAGASLGLGATTLALAPLAGAVGVMIFAWPFPNVLLLGLFAGAVLIARIWLSAAADVRWIVVEPVAAWIDRQEAEAELLRGGNAVINNTNVTASGKAKVAVNAPVMQERVHLVQVNTPGRLIEDIPAPALAFFVDQYKVRGWSQRAWVDQGIRLPGMDRAVDYETWRQCLGLIERVGGVPPIEARRKITPILDLDTIKRKALASGAQADVIDSTAVRE